MDILKYIEWEMNHQLRMTKHRQRMELVDLAIRYSHSVEGIPLMSFGEVHFVSLN